MQREFIFLLSPNSHNALQPLPWYRSLSITSVNFVEAVYHAIRYDIYVTEKKDIKPLALIHKPMPASYTPAPAASVSRGSYRRTTAPAITDIDTRRDSNYNTSTSSYTTYK